MDKFTELKENAIKKIGAKAKAFNLWEYIKEWVIAFAVAAVVYFVILPFFLGSATPLVVVSSCSEKPYLDIGDIVVVNGAKMADIKAPNIDASPSNGFEPVFVQDKFTGVTIAGSSVSPSVENDIVVYYAYPSRMQIIHRALAKINNTYLMTMGDANPIPDQYGNKGICVDENVGCLSTYITQEMLAGKYVFKIPLLGHVKLFFCDMIRFCDGHANVGTNYEYKLTC